MSGKKVALWFFCSAVFGAAVISGCSAQKAQAQTAPVSAAPIQAAAEQSELPEGAGGAPVVYMTADISPAGLMAVYNALGREANGRVAVKIHTGEPGNTHFIPAALMQDLVRQVNGTIVECKPFPAAGGQARPPITRWPGTTVLPPLRRW